MSGRSDTIGKAAEFDSAEEYVNELLTESGEHNEDTLEDLDLKTKIEEAVGLARKGRL